MSVNSQEIVQQIRDHFESLLELVGTSASGKAASAYEIEVNLLRSLLELGRQLLQLFFVCQANQHQEASLLTPQGQCLPYHSQKTRSYWSVFGKIRIQRGYYYRQGHKGSFALDAA